MSHPETERHALRRRAWHAFAAHGDESALSSVPPLLARSWRRSRDCGVDPGLGVLPMNVEHGPVSDPRRDRLLQAARSMLDEIANDLVDAGLFAVVADSGGTILHRRGKTSLLDRAERINVVPGAMAAERITGTNGCGSALVEERVWSVDLYEHYCERFFEWADVGAPVFDPSSGALVGVIDLVLWNKTLTRELVLLAKTLAADVSRRFGDLGRGAAPRGPLRSEGPIRRASPLPDRPGIPATTTAPGARTVRRDGFDEIVGDDPALRAAIDLARRAAATDLPILLAGETGTGKELVARGIHRSSEKAAGPFVAINCGAIPQDLIAAELFGYVKGAFTGAAPGGRRGHFLRAESGTLFLDEITETSAGFQVALLRVLQDREIVPVGGDEAVAVNVRVIAATNRDVEEAVRAGQLRADLYHRLNGVCVTLPALRERVSDVPLLIEHVLGKFAAGTRVDPEVVELLCSYPWPGNVRELESVSRSAALLAGGGVIRLGDLPARILRADGHGPAASGPREPGSLRDAECRAIRDAIDACRGNARQAAKILGMPRSSLYRKLQRYGLMHRVRAARGSGERESRGPAGPAELALGAKTDRVAE